MVLACDTCVVREISGAETLALASGAVAALLVAAVLAVVALRRGRWAPRAAAAVGAVALVLGGPLAAAGTRAPVTAEGVDCGPALAASRAEAHPGATLTAEERACRDAGAARISRTRDLAVAGGAVGLGAMVIALRAGGRDDEDVAAGPPAGTGATPG